MPVLKEKKGFTLIELTLVIAIVGIMLAAASPRFLGFLDRTRTLTDHINLRTLNTATFALCLPCQNEPPVPGDHPEKEQVLMQTLVEKDLLSRTIEPVSDQGRFFFDADAGLWRYEFIK
ncbi:MAG: hypothetical protein AVO33_01460 [delta proteobacterium ML8_F1]|nr:MAG: hypothetical protein AVO33_01460 [delta proteobacterium ML8_F1]